MFGNGFWMGIGGQAPSWVLPNASADLDFAHGNFFGGTVSVSRAQTVPSYATNLDGTLTSFAADTPRIGIGTGLLVEEGRTNVVLQSRDLSNASWTKTTITAAKDQTGADGTANGASSILATGANGTCLQAITLVSSARFQTAYVKRITGSGTINMTMDNGVTWTAISPTTAWTQVSIPTQTLANPTVGFRIVTNGDAIAVDLVQNENGAFATSAIPTTTVAVARVADLVTMALGSWFSPTLGYARIKVLPAQQLAGGDRFLGDSVGNLPIIYRNSNLTFGAFDGTNNPIGAATINSLGVYDNVATSWNTGSNHIGIVQNGGTVVTSNSAGFALTALRIGTGSTPSAETTTSYFARVTFSKTAITDVALQALTV
jgi:hypothetical protein